MMTALKIARMIEPDKMIHIPGVLQTVSMSYGASYKNPAPLEWLNDGRINTLSKITLPSYNYVIQGATSSLSKDQISLSKVMQILDTLSHGQGNANEAAKKNKPFDQAGKLKEEGINIYRRLDTRHEAWTLHASGLITNLRTHVFDAGNSENGGVYSIEFSLLDCRLVSAYVQFMKEAGHSV